MLAAIDYNCSSVYDSQTHSYTLILEWNILAGKCFVPVTSLFDGFTVQFKDNTETAALPTKTAFIPSCEVYISIN